jgi:hypothetical protein
MTKAFLQRFLCAISYSLSLGVYCLSRALMTINKEFCIKGVRDGRGVAFEKRNALDTLAFQSALGISTRARLGAARILRGWNEGNSVLADEGSCAQIIIGGRN